MWHSRLALVAFLTSSAFAQTFRGDGRHRFRLYPRGTG
jgi:hypothetical protein